MPNSGLLSYLIMTGLFRKKMPLLQMNAIETTHLFLRHPIKEDYFK